MGKLTDSDVRKIDWINCRNSAFNNTTELIGSKLNELKIGEVTDDVLDLISWIGSTRSKLHLVAAECLRAPEKATMTRHGKNGVLSKIFEYRIPTSYTWDISRIVDSTNRKVLFRMQLRLYEDDAHKPAYELVYFDGDSPAKNLLFEMPTYRQTRQIAERYLDQYIETGEEVVVEDVLAFLV